VACPQIVIEPARYAPGLVNRMLRRLGQTVPRFGDKLRSDFTAPGHELGIRGRCVVLRKLQHDDRDSQSRFHNPF
jgi:hypothetical protein